MDKFCNLSKDVILDLYTEKNYSVLREANSKFSKFKIENHQLVATAPRSLSAIQSKILADSGLDVLQDESVNSRASSGGHNLLRVIADKTLAKALNEVNLPRIVVDVGSKFKQMDRILDLKNHNSSPVLTQAVQ